MQQDIKQSNSVAGRRSFTNNSVAFNGEQSTTPVFYSGLKFSCSSVISAHSVYLT